MAVKFATLVTTLGSRRVEVRYNACTKREVVSTLSGKAYPAIRLLADARVIVDVGASVGTAAMFFASRYPKATVYAFEPHRESFEIARGNTAPFPNVRLFDVGLHERDQDAELFIGGVTHTTNSVHAGARYNTGRSEPVQLRRASTFLADLGIGQVDILKIDTEGCEVPVVRELLTRYRPRAIHLEYHSEQDRRDLDTLLEGYLVHSGKAFRPHLGVLTYLDGTVFPSLATSGIGPRRSA